MQPSRVIDQPGRQAGNCPDRPLKDAGFSVRCHVVRGKEVQLSRNNLVGKLQNLTRKFGGELRLDVSTPVDLVLDRLVGSVGKRSPSGENR